MTHDGSKPYKRIRTAIILCICNIIFEEERRSRAALNDNVYTHMEKTHQAPPVWLFRWVPRAPARGDRLENREITPLY